VTELKSYPAYKESGVTWLGEVPNEWLVVPAKALLSERKEKSLPADTHLTPSQTHGVLPQAEYMERTGNKVVLNLAGADAMRHVEPNDFISHLRSFQGGFEHSRLMGKVSAAYTVLRPRPNADPEFLRYLFKSTMYIQALQTTTDQLRDGQSIRFAQIALLALPLPRLDEQRAISLFLDRETAEIDAFIADQEELTRLLTERRAATISHAVTKGLDSTVPMRDSGIEWLGEVPAHWTVNRLSRCVSINEGQVNPEIEPYVDMVLIAPNHVTSRTGQLGALESAREQSAESGKYLVRQGQVIYSKIRPALAKVVIAPFDCLCSADMYGLSSRESRQVSQEYLKWMMLSQTFTDYAVDQSARVAMPKLNQDTLGAAPVWYPELHEQETIVSWIEGELAAFDAALLDARKAIALSRERRAALISAAVTGKIDVREHAPSKS
jgi:type I restriction enzyme S subunit